jgi:hypothetical protein
MTLGSELAAKQMLWEYLSRSAVAPEASGSFPPGSTAS